MNVSNIPYLSCILSCVLVLAGCTVCSTSSKNTNIGFDPSSSPFTSSNTIFGDDVSSLYCIAGDITRLDKTDDLLKSITVRFIESLGTAKGTWTPFTNGQNIVIYFYEPLSKSGYLPLKIGRKAELSVIQFQRASDKQVVWRSTFSSIAIEKSGVFIDGTGQKVIFPPNTALEPTPTAPCFCL
jgi:hypothetical protein